MQAVAGKIRNMSNIKSLSKPQSDDLAPRAPDEPDAFACCGNECGESCVWTIYQHACRRYERDLLAWQARQLEQKK
jgi:hypothetical protein